MYLKIKKWLIRISLESCSSTEPTSSDGDQENIDNVLK
jgi:hypothetical protein